MPKPRTKRGAVREEKKRKRQEESEHNAIAKRQRQRQDGQDDNEDENDGEHWAGAGAAVHDEENPALHHGIIGEREFFGMLADEEQEYFRRADEMLELNQFPSSEDRDVFLESVWREAKGKELKVASSQSCSRLMERLIQISTTAQKKQLFDAFAGHFLSLVQHRFASHCCEALFLKSAGVVTQELSGFSSFVVDVKGAGADADDQSAPEASMEHLFLATLDELEGNLTYLLTDRFASHTLRVLLLVLSGRPLEDASVRTLLKSKKKEKISVAGGKASDEASHGLRAVPASFTTAVQKIIEDSVSTMDATGLRVLAKHPIGNPTLQLLLELDLSTKKGDAKTDSAQPTLIFQLLPGAPKSLSDETSEASEFINGMVYDQIGSRLVETIITHAPGRIFKALNHNIFLPRIQGYVRNDVSSYAAIRVLNRLGKDDLKDAVDKITPTVPQLVEKARFNVLRALFERSAARGLSDEIKQLMKGLREGCGTEPADLVRTLCCLASSAEEEQKKKKKDVAQLARNEYAIQSHGAQLLATLLDIPGPSKGVQEGLLALEPAQLVRLATASVPAVTVITKALATPSSNPAFHKTIVGTITPHLGDLASSQNGHNLVNAVVEIPSKGRERSVPFHLKEAIMARLGDMERQLRDSWMGRSVWRTWKGDMWKTRRGDWKVWMREVDAAAEDAKKKAASAANRTELGPSKGGKNGGSKGQHNENEDKNGDIKEDPAYEEAPEESPAEEAQDVIMGDAEQDSEAEKKERRRAKKEKKEKKEKEKKEKKDKKEKKEKKEKRSKTETEDED